MVTMSNEKYIMYITKINGKYIKQQKTLVSNLNTDDSDESLMF